MHAYPKTLRPDSKFFYIICLHISGYVYREELLTSSPSYLIRAELIGLHEGDVSYKANPVRGAQFYPDCVQIEVTGDGTVELPEGVSFPGAYSYEDPGVVHNVSALSISISY